MKTTKPGRSRIHWALALGLGLALAPSVGWADELTKFTGYTRPGNPTGPAGPLAGAARLVDEGTIGATVYFRVFELGGDEATDPWGTGVKNLENSFVPGQASRGRAIDKLDTTARYLYVYQVINDSYRDAQVKSVAIRLLIPPHLITSWGHFAAKGTGAGFAMEFDNPDPKNPNSKSMVLPVSTEHPGVSDALYRNPAPYFHAPKPYSHSNILLHNKPVFLSADGENTGREPERVVLQTMVNFEGAPNWLVKDRVQTPGPLALPSSNLGNPYSNPFSPLTPPLSGLNSIDNLRRAPAVVAYWTDDPLRPGMAGFQPGQRSTMFGFTSNFPPVYEDVRVQGNSVVPFRGPLAFVADARSANLRVDGQVPTPVALEPCCVPVAPRPGSFGGPVGGIGAGGGLLRGGGGFGSGGSGNGAGNGSGNGSGNLTSSQLQQLQALAQAALQAQAKFSIGNQSQTRIVNVQQSQAQSQAQAQLQAQQQRQNQNRHHHGHVVPEPAAVVSALLGVPVLLLLVWRRKMTPVPLQG